MDRHILGIDLRPGFCRVYWRNAGWPDNMARPSYMYVSTQRVYGLSEATWESTCLFSCLLFSARARLPLTFFSGERHASVVAALANRCKGSLQGNNNPSL